MGIVAATAAGNAWLMQPMLDKVFVGHDTTLLYVIPAGVIVMAFAKGLAGYGQAVLMMTVGQRIVADMQKMLFARMMRADLAFFHANPTGTLVARFINDASMLRSSATSLLAGLGKEAVTAIGLVILMFYQDWMLAMVSVIAFPFVVRPLARLGRRMRRISTNTQVEVGRLTTLLDQVFQGARHVKAYGMEHYEQRRADTVIERLFHLVQRAQRVRSIPSPLMETLGGVAVAGVILYGGHQVIIGERTPGAFFSFITALLLAYQPMKVLASLNIGLQEGLAAAARLFAMLDIEPDIRDRPNARPLAFKSGAIRFDNVTFDYPNGTRALDGVELTVPAGKTVALVGASGAGKSTIFNLIPRFYDIVGGSITIDGVDIRDATIASLRATIALVSQEVSLFDDTVRANIAYGRLDAPEQDIVAAAAAAAADGFIRELSDGYNTEVGEHGTKFSGGQRQRIAIARAMLKNAPILLLDEATSALDTRVRTPSASGVAAIDGGPHHARHRSSAVDGHRRRPDLRHRPRPGHRTWHSCRVNAQGRCLCPALFAAIRRAGPARRSRRGAGGARLNHVADEAAWPLERRARRCCAGRSRSIFGLSGGPIAGARKVTRALTRAMPRGRPYIGAFWHGRLLMMPHGRPRVMPLAMLISPHGDGRIIAEAVRHLGIDIIPGSSNRGAGPALRALVRTLQHGSCVAITPDGPDGPAMAATAGVIQVARLSGAPIFPITYATSRRRILASWDRFHLPLPFGRGIFLVDAPITVPPDADDARVEALRSHLETRLRAITAEADRRMGHGAVAPGTLSRNAFRARRRATARPG